MSVFAAWAMDRRHSSQPSLAMPSQSTATSTIGLGGPSRMIALADNGSTIFSAGFTPAEQQSGEPNGGVTSTLNVATRSGSAANAAATETRNSAERRKRIHSVISRDVTRNGAAVHDMLMSIPVKTGRLEIGHLRGAGFSQALAGNVGCRADVVRK